MTELKPCPVCEGIAEVYIGEKDLWKVGCANCRIFATDKKKDEAIRLWNEVNSKEVKADSALRPCPFCGCELEFKRYMRGHPIIIEYFDIRHPDNGCILSDFDDSYTDYDMLLKQWNRRAGE